MALRLGRRITGVRIPLLRPICVGIVRDGKAASVCKIDGRKAQGFDSSPTHQKRYIMLDHLKASPPIIILYAVALHFIWAICLFVNPNVLHITAMGTYLDYFSPTTPHATLLGILFCVVAILAVVGLFVKDKLSRLLLMIPQQMMLVISAAGALQAMISGSFADGVIRTHSFLIADQLPAILVATGHFIAVAILSM